MEANQIATGVLWFLAFLFSTTVHEAMHAWAALKGGDPTAYHAGQVSLSPLPHIRREPFGMLVLPLLTAVTQGWAIGWASSPYDPHWAARYPRRAAWMAAAGPAGNLLIALGSFTLLKLGLLSGWFAAPPVANFHTLVAPGAGESIGGLGTALSILLVLNVFLAVFNLLPLPPLDGAAVLGLFVPEDQMDRLRAIVHQPWAPLVGLLIAWKIFPFLTGPLFGLILRLLHPMEGYS
jgi:Zn-dependent protease